MFYIVNRFIPDRSVGSRVALISAITSTSLWWIAGRAFAWYLSAFHSYSKLYGTYAFVLVFLMWIYYSSVVFIIGTIIGDLYRKRHPGGSAA
jgi:membrane protein